MTGGATWTGRVEDFRLVRGAGSYADDVRRPGQLAAIFVRSPHAHARIVSIDAEAARAAPGVFAVLTAEDMDAAGLRNVTVAPPLAGRDGRKLVVPARPALARDRVRHVGDAVALVVAESAAAAQDAAELVAIDYDDLSAVTDTERALQPDAPELWPKAPGNLAFDWPGPVPDEANEAEVARILEAAAHVVRFTAVNQRLAGAPLEPRGATAEYDPAGGRYTIRVGSQGAGPLRAQLATIMGVEPATIRVLTEDVGGAFGLKTPAYPEYPALMVAARMLGRPVHWMGTRSESFMSDNQGRDSVVTGELALDETGRFLALRLSSIANMGAYLSSNGAHIATNNFARCFPTVYSIPKIAIGVRCVYTNTLPTAPYRGAGRPEANYIMERLVDAAARQTGINRVELRRRNLTRPDAMPYRTAAGTTIDSGEFETIFDEALAAADYYSFKDRRTVAARRGKLRGIGISCFLEHSGAVGIEGADLAFTAPGRLTLRLGVQSTGQGHATAFRELLAERLGIPVDSVSVLQGDSDIELKGGPSVASRSAMTVTAAMESAIEQLIAKGRRLAATLLQASADDIAYSGGAFRVTGTERSVGLFALAEEAAAMRARGEAEESLDTRAVTEVPQSFPNGCHIAEVEIEPETGHVEVVHYTAVDDCGTVLNHVLVEGQLVGGLAQGLGQALLERVVHEPETGQLITGTFNDYAMPRAEAMPPVTAAEHPVFCRTNPLGVKGVGEAGTTAAIAAIMNAIADAIPGEAGAALQMPATPEKVWRACRTGFTSRD